MEDHNRGQYHGRLRWALHMRAVFLALVFVLCTAQVSPPGFPPGTFLSRGALDATSSGTSPITFIAGVTTASSNSTDVTSDAIDSSGANLIVVVVADYAGGATNNVTDNKGNCGGGWNQLTAQSVGGVVRERMFYCAVTSVGSNHTVSITGTQPAIGVAAFSNTNASPFDSSVGTTGTSANPAGGSITPSADNGLVVSGVSNLSTSPASVDSSFIVIGAHISPSGNSLGLDMAYIIQTTAGATNPTWTENTSNPWAATNAAFKN